MNSARLLKLADFLDKLPEEKFDFTIIAAERGKPMLEALAAGHTQCGTVACAIGWTPAVFPDELQWVPSFTVGTDLDIRARNWLPFSPFAGTWNTIEEFFEISYEAASFLFMPEHALPSTAGPREVAAHIRAFVQGTEP